MINIIQGGGERDNSAHQVHRGFRAHSAEDSRNFLGSGMLTRFFHIVSQRPNHTVIVYSPSLGVDSSLGLQAHKRNAGTAQSRPGKKRTDCTLNMKRVALS
jgi:hypothetical protein